MFNPFLAIQTEPGHEVPAGGPGVGQLPSCDAFSLTNRGGIPGVVLLTGQIWLHELGGD